MLRILTADKISNTLLREEVSSELIVENKQLSRFQVAQTVMDFVWHHSVNYIFPLCDETACEQSSAAKKLAQLGMIEPAVIKNSFAFR